jgi:hypothetical protein
MLNSTMVFMLGLLAGAADTLALSTADWAPPWRAEALVSNAALAAFVHELDRRPATAMDGGSAENAGAAFPPAVLQIRHAGGAAGGGFAEQLRDALVALGLPSARSRLVPAAADAGRLILEISANGESQP